MATKLTTGFMRTPTYKSSLDGNTTSLNMPSVFDSITKYKNIETSKILGEYTTYTPPSKGKTSGLIDIGWSALKGFVDYTQYAGEPVPASQQTPEKRTNFFKAVGNSLLAGMISLARHTVSNAPAFMGEASEEDIQKTKDTLQKIVDVTIPKEGQTTKPLWQGAFQRQADRASSMPEATKALAGVTETIQQAPAKTEKFLRTEEDAARQRADIQNAATVTKWMAGVAESLPLSLSTRIPAIGWILMYNTSFRSSLEQSMLDNPNPTAEQGNMIMVKAVADAALEVGTEMIFPLYGSTMATAKGIAKGTIKPTLANATKGLVSFFKKGAVQEAITPTIKNVAKQILKNAAEEGAEEAINYFLGAYVAVLTTEQGKNVWSVKENQESVASVAGLIDATMTGAISGGGIAGTRSAIPTSAYYYDKFQNTKQAVDKVGDKTINQVTAKDAEILNDAIMQDMNNPENATKVTEAVVEAVQKSTVPQQPTQQPTAALQAETVSLSDWVSNTNAKAKLQAETAIDQLNQEFNSNNPDAIRIAEALYNLQRWQKTNGVTISQEASKAMSSINIYLSNNNIKIVDMTGQKYDAGLAVDVVYSDKIDLTNDAYISEMQQPIIIQNNKVVSFGKVMLSSQQPSAVTQEPTRPLQAETVSEPVNIKKGSYVSIDGQGVGLVENVYEDGAMTISISGQSYHRAASDTDYRIATAAEYWTDIKRQIKDAKSMSASKRKSASEYNKSTGDRAVARKGKVDVQNGMIVGMAENNTSAYHRAIIKDANEAKKIADSLTKQMESRKRSLQNKLDVGVSLSEKETIEAKALGMNTKPKAQAQPKAETKVEQERVTASETIAQESQKQDRSGIEGIVAPGTVAAMGNVPVQAKKQSWQDTISAETKQRFEDSSTPIDKEPIKERLSRWKEMFREYVTLGSVPIPVEMGDLRVEFRKMRTAFAQAKMKATRIIELSYNQVGKERFDLMSKAILYLDINEDLKKGLYNQGSAMQFGIKSPQEAIATIRAIVQEIRKPENQVVMDALKTRRRMMDSIRNDLLTQARKAGVDLELINNRKDYMYHAVIAYQQDFNRMAKSKKGKKRVEYLGRTGSIQDYVSDPVFSDYIIIGKMVSDTYRLRLFNEIKKQDISSTLKQAPTGEYIIPDGYAEMDVAMLGMPRLDHYSKQLIVRNASINLANLGIQKGSQAWNAAMKSAYSQANKNNVVVPESVVKAIEYEFGKKERYVGRSMKFVMNAWKYSKLRLPNVVIRYNIRNLMGDLDAMVIGNPVAMLKIPKAVTELYKFYYKKGVLTPALADFVESTGLVTGQTAQELKTLKSHSSFEFYDKSQKPADVVKRGVKKAWSVLTMETATDFREQILRYAAYLEFLEQVKRSKTGTLKNYAMSIPAEIDSITDVKEKAAKLANDMIGAYDDVSIFGQYAADHLMPFFRFKEINIKRYYRLTKNMFYTSPEVLQDVGTGIAGSLGKAGRVGAFTLMKMAKVAISVSLFYGALQLFNNLMSPEEEDKLPEDIKKRPHITLPAWLVGPNRVYYIDRLGSLAELLDIFGIDRSLGSDLNDVITGRMKLEDKMKEMLMSPVHDIFNSSFPLAKMSVELITGKELFPDPSNPKQMRDRWEYIFNQVGFRDEYKALAGKPIIEGSYTKQKRSIIFSSVVPGDAAYWDVYDMTDDFYKRHDISQRSSSWSDPSSKDAKKANAAYYYKVALKMQDTKAAERYLKEYVFYGGTKSTFESTMRSMAPLHWMSKTDKKLFFSEMTAQEKEQYDKAVAYFEELMKIKATSLP